MSLGDEKHVALCEISLLIFNCAPERLKSFRNFNIATPGESFPYTDRCQTHTAEFSCGAANKRVYVFTNTNLDIYACARTRCWPLNSDTNVEELIPHNKNDEGKRKCPAKSFRCASLSLDRCAVSVKIEFFPQ